MCKCTSFGHDDVRREIVAQDMRSIPEVMQKLHWTTPDGCSSCRPALNYYLLCALPGDYVDDQQSRFVNERLHANIQKDGTYRSEEHTSELQSLMRNSYAVFCLKKKKHNTRQRT